MRWDISVKLAFAAWLIGWPVYLISTGLPFWDAVLGSCAINVAIGFALFALWICIGIPIVAISKSVSAPKRERRKADQVWGWFFILAGGIAVWWGYSEHEGGPVFLGIVLIVVGAGLLGGAWRTDQF